MKNYNELVFSKTRIASIDVCEMGKQKHHVAALLEINVSLAREKIKKYSHDHHKISFTAWLIKAISLTLKDYEQVAGYLKGKRKLVVFNDINVSILVEKEVNGQKVPIPLVIENASERTIESITEQIKVAREIEFTNEDMVLQRKSMRVEKIYYLLPGFLRRAFWRYLLSHPHYAFQKMGNVSFTSIGMVGSVNGWFIPIGVHPVCFGVSALVKKPVVNNDKIEIGEVLNLTVLLDHDVVDGAPMARFINKLSQNLEEGIGIQY
jgi:pyruvate/2-oxoglutarate dehydrogenase complex dihydrolipoamide acyltransferase (E2) component